MVHHPKRHAYEDGSPKFWLLFFVGLVIVLVMFRAFVGAVDGRGGFKNERHGEKETVRRNSAKEALRKRERNSPTDTSLKAKKLKDV